jgi:hypothetical protein
MNMKHDEIRDATSSYLALLSDDAIDGEALEDRLSVVLDNLAVATHNAEYTFDERDYPDPPKREYADVRSIVTRRFPELGTYNVPASITTDIATAACNVGDAIDDLTDIALELFEVEWRLQHTSRDDAIWFFKNNFVMHWGQHLRSLQLCLHARKHGL